MTTEPVTVIDPVCTILAPTKDLGSSIGKILLSRGAIAEESAQSMITGYQELGGAVSEGH